MFALEQLDHVAIAVADPMKSAAWYGEVLGLARRHQEVWGDYPIMMAAGTTMVALFPANAMERATPVAVGLHLRHFAFRADWSNYQQAQASLAQRGIQFEEQDHIIARSIYFRDPDGHQIEITTYDRGRMQNAE